MNLLPRIGHSCFLIITIMVASSAPAVASPVPDNATRHLGMAGLGLMASALGVLWTRRRRVIHRRRRRYLREFRLAPLPPQPSSIPEPSASPGHSSPRHRIRRFDYDRFYLHMLRDL